MGGKRDMDPKLRAAIVAAINAYLDEEALAVAPGKKAGWGRQGRLDAMRTSQACFARPRRWR